APTEETVGRVGTALAAGELPAHWLLFRFWSIVWGEISVKQPFPRTTPLQRWLVDHPDITIQIPWNHTEHLLLLIFCFKKSGGRILFNDRYGPRLVQRRIYKFICGSWLWACSNRLCRSGTV